VNCARPVEFNSKPMVINEKYSYRLLVINQYYVPDIASTGQYAAAICGALARCGHEVHVITAQPSYTASSPVAPSFELLDGVHVHRVSLGPFRGRERLTTRLGGYALFLWGAWRYARRLLRNRCFDAVITFHNPPFVPVIGASLGSIYGIPYVYIPYDIHPDVLIAMGWPIPKPVLWAWERLNQKIFQQARAIVVLSEGMKSILQGKGVSTEKVWIIPLWGLPEFETLPSGEPIREEMGIGKDDLMFLYAGNLGTLHPADPILDAAAKVRDLPVHFVFVGDGIRKEYLRKRAQALRLTRVRFLPYQPEERFAQLVAAADACLVVLGRGVEQLALPSRAFTFLSAGKPLITLMDSHADMARLVTETGCGWNVSNGEELAALVQNLVGNIGEIKEKAARAKMVYRERFQRITVLQAYISLINGLLTERARPSERGVFDSESAVAG